MAPTAGTARWAGHPFGGVGGEHAHVIDRESDGVGVWRNYKEQLAPVMPLLDPWVKTFGYDAE